MTTLSIQVTWGDSGPNVSNHSISISEATTINWTCDTTTVAGFAVVFGENAQWPTGLRPNSTTFSVSDIFSLDQGTYHYSVFVLSTGGDFGRVDPTIENGTD